MVEADAQRRQYERECKHQKCEWARVHGTDLEILRLRDNGAFGSRFRPIGSFAATLIYGCDVPGCSCCLRHP